MREFISRDSLGHALLNESPTALQQAGLEFNAQVRLAGLAATDVAVQLYANGVDGAGPQVYDMTLLSPADHGGSSTYRVVVPASRPAR